MASIRAISMLIFGCLAFGHSGAESAMPKPGQWEGAPSVSFSISEPVRIIDFNLSAPLEALPSRLACCG